MEKQIVLTDTQFFSYEKKKTFTWKFSHNNSISLHKTKLQTIYNWKQNLLKISYLKWILQNTFRIVIEITYQKETLSMIHDKRHVLNRTSSRPKILRVFKHFLWCNQLIQLKREGKVRSKSEAIGIKSRSM